LKKRPTTRAFLRLRDEVSGFAGKSEDPIVRTVGDVIEEFSHFVVIGEEYNWSYLSDEEYRKQVVMVSGAREANRLFLSHIMRSIEAFEIISIWRMADLAAGTIRNLNNFEVISACTLARSMIELSVRYGDAANFLYRYFENINWALLDVQIAKFCIGQDEASETLEEYVEKLFHATRLDTLLEKSELMKAKNILTIIESMDKRLKKQFGYSVMSHYEVLCEIAHPNTLGYQRYLDSISKAARSGWDTRHLRRHANSSTAAMLISECLWAVSFSLSGMNGCFGVFQTLKKNYAEKMGRPLP
jgi:hypothetical protein